MEKQIPCTFISSPLRLDVHTPGNVSFTLGKFPPTKLQLWAAVPKEKMQRPEQGKHLAMPKIRVCKAQAEGWDESQVPAAMLPENTTLCPGKVQEPSPLLRKYSAAEIASPA